VPQAHPGKKTGVPHAGIFGLIVSPYHAEERESANGPPSDELGIPLVQTALQSSFAVETLEARQMFATAVGPVRTLIARIPGGLFYPYLDGPAKPSP